MGQPAEMEILLAACSGTVASVRTSHATAINKVEAPSTRKYLKQTTPVTHENQKMRNGPDYYARFGL